MYARLIGHARRNLVAYLALFVALGGTSYAAVKVTGVQIVDGTVSGADIRDRSIQARDIRRGTLRADLFARGQLNGVQVATGPQGPQGPKGDTGPQGATGPSFGESISLPNVANLACNTETVVGQQTVTVTRPSRILAFGNGAIIDDAAQTTEYGLYLRLRNAADTQTLALTGVAWDFDSGAPAADVVMPLSVTGVLLNGTDVESLTGGTLVAQPGSYRLQLVALPTGGACADAARPDFGYNQSGSMGYVILGNG